MQKLREMSNKTTDIRKKILSILKLYTLSTREISSEIGTTYSTTLKYLEILHASSLVENKVYGKTKVWSLKKTDPFDLDINSLIYLLLKNSWEKFQNYEILEEILNSFYSQALELNKEQLSKFRDEGLIQKYLELETKQKWKDIEGYDIIEDIPSEIKVKVYDCKYKFGCCANFYEKNIDIFCINGYKLQCILNFFADKKYQFEMIDFTIDPSTCIFKLKKNNL